jgi:hypothetical protein
MVAVTLMGASAASAQVYRDRDGRYDRDRYERSGRFDRGDRYQRQNWDDRGYSNNQRRTQLDRRADQIAQRARNLHRNGRLSRDHMERTLEKLQRVRSTVRNNSRIDDRRFQADIRWLDQVERTMEQWSRAHTNRRFGRR